MSSLFKGYSLNGDKPRQRQVETATAKWRQNGLVKTATIQNSEKSKWRQK